MKKIVLTFGLISGAILGVLMCLTLPFIEEVGDAGAIIGYTTMVLAFSLIYFAIRTYRDNELGGKIGFGKSLQIGLLITLIGSTCYVATWEVIYWKFMPNFVEKYSTRILEKAKTSGATQAQLDKTKKEMADFATAYNNPLVNVGYTYLEVFPVGLVITLISAGVASRKRKVAA